MYCPKDAAREGISMDGLNAIYLGAELDVLPVTSPSHLPLLCQQLAGGSSWTKYLACNNLSAFRPAFFVTLHRKGALLSKRGIFKSGHASASPSICSSAVSTIHNPHLNFGAVQQYITTLTIRGVEYNTMFLALHSLWAARRQISVQSAFGRRPSLFHRTVRAHASRC